MKPFIKKFKEIRKNEGLTQFSFAEKLGVSRSTIAQIEMGKNTPTTDLLIKIIDRFCISPNYLFNYSSEDELLIETSEFPIVNFIEQYERFNTNYSTFCALSILIESEGGLKAFEKEVENYKYLTLNKEKLFELADEKNFKKDLINQLEDANGYMTGYIHYLTYELFRILNNENDFFKVNQIYKNTFSK